VKTAFIFPGSVTDTAWNEAGYRAMEAFRGRHSEMEVAWVHRVYDRLKYSQLLGAMATFQVSATT